MSSRHFGRIYLLALLFTVVTGIGGCDGEDVVGAMGAVQGTVVDPTGGNLTSAMLTVDGTSYSTLTNVEGRYVMNMPAGNYRITAAKDGYRPLSLPVTIESGSIGGRLDFTLATTSDSEGRLRLDLRADGETYTTGRPVELQLTVTSTTPNLCAIRTAGFFAQDGMGNVLWRHETATDPEIVPAASTDVTVRWPWYEGGNTTVVLGGPVACYGYVRCDDGVERISHPVTIVLTLPVPEPTPVPFDTLERGSSSGFYERLATVITSVEEWKRFYGRHAPEQLPPTVDFHTYSVVAALGGRCASPVALVDVLSIERLPPYRPAADAMMIALPDRYRCRIAKHLSADVICVDAVTSPYHFVVVPRLNGPVDFQWIVDRTVEE